MVEARYGHYLMFADGFFVLIFKRLPVKIGDEDWLDVWFSPSQGLIDYYNIKDSEFVTLPNVQRMLLKRTIKMNWIVPLNFTPGEELWFAFCNAQGTQLSPTKIFGIKDYEARLEAYEKQILTKDLEIYRLNQELKEMAEKPSAVKKKWLQELKETKDIVSPPQMPAPQQYIEELP